MGCYELPLARWSKEIFLKKMFFDLVFEALTELHTWMKIREMGIAYVKINLGSTWIVSQKWHKSLGKKSSRWTRYQGVSGYFINSLRWLGGGKICGQPSCRSCSALCHNPATLVGGSLLVWTQAPAFKPASSALYSPISSACRWHV